MKKMIQKFSLTAGKVDRRHVQIFMALVVLSMLVLGAGAPGMNGGPGGW
jgi:hypothetical protein